MVSELLNGAQPSVVNKAAGTTDMPGRSVIAQNPLSPKEQSEAMASSAENYYFENSCLAPGTL